MTAQPYRLLAEALRREGKQPQVELCRWRPDVDHWPSSVFEREPDFVPTPERPLVFHVFGHLGFEESLVLTEDDYLDFLARVAADDQLVPLAVQKALADSALLFIGFRLEEWDVRVLLRALVSREAARKLEDYTHVAAQIDLGAGVMSPARARRYLERYFGKGTTPSFDIFWGTVDEFAADARPGVGRKPVTTVEPAEAPPPADRPNPYPGARPFSSDETIYGRGREVTELRDLLIARRIVLLYSPSGAGKSSLIEAGLRPRLQHDFRVLPTIRVSLQALPPCQWRPGTPTCSARSCRSRRADLQTGG